MCVCVCVCVCVYVLMVHLQSVTSVGWQEDLCGKGDSHIAICHVAHIFGHSACACVCLRVTSQQPPGKDGSPATPTPAAKVTHHIVCRIRFLVLRLGGSKAIF